MWDLMNVGGRVGERCEWKKQGDSWSALAILLSPSSPACSFKEEVYSCLNCCHSLQKDLVTQVNSSLQQTLINMFPGYDSEW